ncbi:hypothetical protein GCM10009104_02790 [Marinobacterium maritimum]|uniref:HTH arsR-type domain-containing protein n=1 Tax=Marinobacterium maritimum TaxID=500162 RepID=A0ABP3T554_9GAMM
MDPAVVGAALKRLQPEGVEWVSYTCQISGKTESILLIGDDLASRLTGLLPEAEDANGMKVLAGLYTAELCECDVATLTRLSEEEVIRQLERFASRGTVTHRTIHGMNYYRLDSEVVRRTLKDALEALR